MILRSSLHHPGLVLLLAAALSLGGVSCQSRTKALTGARVQAVRLGSVTAVPVDEAAVRKDYTRSAFKKSLGRQVLGASLLLAGGVAAGAVGGQAAVQGYSAGIAADSPSLIDPGRTARNSAALTEADQQIALQHALEKRLPAALRARLEKAVAAEATVKSRIKPSADCRLEIQLQDCCQEVSHGEHYLSAGGTARILSAGGQCLWSTTLGGLSYRKEGVPPAPVVKSAADLLSPPVLDRHLDALAGTLAQSLTEELVGVFETLDEAAAKP